MKLESRTHQPARRGGAVIIVVVSLMATLAFLGLFFYNWTNQERINAEYFSDTDPVEIDPDPIVDFGLQQALVSTNSSLTNSALFGSRWSLLAHIMGPMNGDGSPTRAQPYTGRGIRLFNPTSTGFSLDYDGDSTTTADQRNQTDFVLNFSPLANGGSSPSLPFNPAAGYTYPDINSLFLAVDYVDPLNNARRIIKPSFALPGYFPGLRTSGYGDWYKSTGSTLARQVLRPHDALTSRYETSAVVARSGDRNRIIEPFPFDVGNLGVWSGSGNDYDFDYDLDGDGFEDSIAMDLDHPIMDLPNGRQVVPIYYWKIVDLDGLLNVNVHGHMPEVALNSRAGSASAFDDIGNRATFAHYSNLGMSPAEVNLAYGLYADPSSSEYLQQTAALRDWATLNHRGMLAERYDGTMTISPPNDRAPSAAFNRLNMANMELAMLLLGRPEFQDDLEFLGSTTITGRYGEESFLRSALDVEGDPTPSGAFNGPGTSGTDDDNDRAESSQRTVTIGASINIPPFIHPLDYLGTGSYTTALDNSANSIVNRDRSSSELGARVLSAGNLTNNPMRFPRYPTGAPWHTQKLNPTAVETYLDAMAGQLQLSTVNQLIDEADEVTVNSAYGISADDPFHVREIAALQLSDGDWNAQPQASRVRALAPFNFEYNRKASEIRSQFTTESWDRLQYAFAAQPGRAWEFNHTAADGSQRFPPEFGVAASEHEDGTISVGDPFRPEVRRLLTKIQSGGTIGDARFPQRRLNINRILSDDTYAGGNDAFDANNNPVYRDLIPHATGTLTTVEAMLHDNPNGPHPTATHPFNLLSTINSDNDVREWWARYDRQRLARDIYVLLATVGDSTNPTATALDPARAREMAQFAVNYVDALDRDNVITKFEYDEDLSDGWDTAPTGVVYGIERQQLAFSEVMSFRTNDPGASSDLDRTLHDESNVVHRFLYFELRNISPFDVELEDNSWRIVRRNPTSNAWEARVELKTDGGTAKVIPAGENFLMGCHSDDVGGGNSGNSITNGSGNPIGTELYADYTGGSELELVVPFDGATTTLADNDQVPAAVLDLDLTGPDHVNFRNAFELNTSFIMGPMGEVRETLIRPEEPGVSDTFVLTLERRVNPGVDGSTGDWVEVDRILVNDERLFDVSTGATQSDINTFLTDTSTTDGFFSRERLHPWTQTDLGDYPTGSTAATAPFHTFDSRTTQKNLANLRWRDANPGDPYWMWQPHFDRDFSSVMELMAIPLYGTTSYDDTATPETFMITLHGGVSGNLVSGNAMSGTLAAQAKFNNPGTDNLWYRLFGFVEVPPRAEQSVTPPVERRTPGKINLNTLRHEHVLAGLVDDSVHHNYLDGSFDDDDPTVDLLESNKNDRWWMQELIRKRDGFDAGTNQLPGTQFAKPFRPAHFLENSTSPDIEHSLLRRNRSGTANALGLFEARDSSDVGVNVVDYHTRQRILAKVANNTTTRSHVFAIWTGFSLHEAHVDGGDVKVGARADDLPTYRQFIVVDMSRLEEAFDSGTGTFDFRKFIIHRQMLP